MIKIAQDLLTALNFLHNICKIIHTDIKPENIAISNCTDKNLTVKLIDFGSACLCHYAKPQTVTSLNYRAPEVVLKLGWNEKCDIWSLGCVIFELLIGKRLFDEKSETGLVKKFGDILGPIPNNMIFGNSEKLNDKDECIDLNNAKGQLKVN